MEYFCEDEKAEQLEPGKWTKGNPVTTPGKPLQIDGTQGGRIPSGQPRRRNFAQFKQYYGLENDPTLVEPGWARS